MRIYKNMAETISEIGRDLSEMGVEIKTKSMQNKNIEDNDEYTTKEIQAYSFCVLNSNDKDEMVGDCLDWCKAEFVERCSVMPINPGTAYLLRENVWKEYLNSKGKFDYTYSERLNGQTESVLSVLKNDPSSRQAIIQIYDKSKDNKNRGGKARIPCSIFYNIQIRNGKVDIHYVMRSCDFDLHFKNDMWHACEVRDFIAKRLKLENGKLFMFISSLHRYKKYCTGVF